MLPEPLEEQPENCLDFRRAPGHMRTIGRIDVSSGCVVGCRDSAIDWIVDGKRRAEDSSSSSFNRIISACRCRSSSSEKKRRRYPRRLFVTPQLTVWPRNRSAISIRVARTWLLMSDSEKRRPAPLVERIRSIKRDNMMAVQSRTADLPAPFTPTRTLICSGNSNLSSGIPLNPAISMDSILICLPAYRQQNVEHRPERRNRTPARRVRCRAAAARRKYPHANEGSCDASNAMPSPTWRS